MAGRLKADERRERLVRAARKLFATRGYEATRMEDIAEAAGCTTGPLYHFFKTKQDVYVAAIRAATAESGATMQTSRGAHAEAGPLEQILLTCDYLLDLLANTEAVSFVRDAPRALGYAEWNRFNEEMVVRLLETDLRNAMIEGEIEPEPPQPLASILASAILAAANHAIDGADADSVERFRSAIRRVILRLKLPIPITPDGKRPPPVRRR